MIKIILAIALTLMSFNAFTKDRTMTLEQFKKRVESFASRHNGKFQFNDSNQLENNGIQVVTLNITNVPNGAKMIMAYNPATQTGTMSCGTVKAANMIGYGTVPDEVREDDCFKDVIEFYKNNPNSSQQERTNIAQVETSIKEATAESIKEQNKPIMSNEVVKSINKMIDDENIDIQIDKTLDSMELSKDDEKFLEPIYKIALLYSNKISDKLTAEFHSQDVIGLVLREFRLKVRRAALIGLKSKLSQEMIVAQITQIGESILAR